MATDSHQLVRYLFLRLDPAWRRLAPTEQVAHKREFGDRLTRPPSAGGLRADLLLRTYSLVGTRGDADLLLWQVADGLEALQALQTAVFSTQLGAYLSVPYSYLAVNRRSTYEIPESSRSAGPAASIAARPQDSRYLFVYPFVKSREWYALPRARRQELMEEHVSTARRHPAIRANTAYSFGLDDQEFVLAFEGDDPADFADLVMELRETRASAYTHRDTPVFTCIQMSLWDALDSLGGASAAAATGAAAGVAPANGDGLVAVAGTAEVPPGRGKRVYHGADAVALFNVSGSYYAVSDRCPHGRASLSEGVVDAASCMLTCPWHGGAFDLRSGVPVGGPVRVPLRAYRVTVEDDRILIGSPAPEARQLVP
jgi:chlorite dismutase